MMEMRLTKVTLIIEETADTQAMIHMIVIAGMMTMITMTMTTMMMIMITRKDRGEPGCRKILGLDTGERKAPQKGEGRKTPYPVSGKRSRKQNGKLILLIQLIATALFLASAVYLGMIPWLYLGAAAIVLLILVLLVYRMQNGFRKKRFLGALLGLLISAVLLVAAFYMFEVRSALNDITDGNEAPELSEAAAGVNVSEDPFSVYISGIDVYGDITQQSRSDVNIIATVNPKTKQILLVTTPRDYYVPIPGVSEGYPDKLTHAGTYGIATSMATLEELYDVDIPFYVRVNFTSLIEMVDTLGGIDVESDIAFTTGEESGLVVEVKEGTNHFNGQEALAFCRERHALAEGDNQRGKNQQAVIEAMLKKAMSPSILIKGPRLIDQGQRKYRDQYVYKPAPGACQSPAGRDEWLGCRICRSRRNFFHGVLLFLFRRTAFSHRAG